MGAVNPTLKQLIQIILDNPGKYTYSELSVLSGLSYDQVTSAVRRSKDRYIITGYCECMEIEELKRRHHQYIQLMRSKIVEVANDRDLYKDKYTALKKAAMAIGVEAAVINELTQHILLLEGLLERYQRHYKKNTRTRSGEVLAEDTDKALHYVQL